MEAGRLADIRRFQAALADRLEHDPSPLTGFERAVLLGILDELVQAADPQQQA